MKKLLCLSVAAAMACTMTACSGSSSPSSLPLPPGTRMPVIRAARKTQIRRQETRRQETL
mgnify:CR=1 FL=1